MEEAREAGVPPWVLGFWSPFNHTELRDDRALFFSNELPPGVHTVSVVARATTPGDSCSTGVAEEMYTPEVFGRSEGGTFQVLDDGSVAGAEPGFPAMARAAGRDEVSGTSLGGLRPGGSPRGSSSSWPGPCRKACSTRTGRLSLRVLDRDGELLKEFPSGGRPGAPRSRADAPVPPALRDAFIASEDRRFEWHPGVDPLAMVRARRAT